MVGMGPDALRPLTAALAALLTAPMRRTRGALHGARAGVRLSPPALGASSHACLAPPRGAPGPLWEGTAGPPRRLVRPAPGGHAGAGHRATGRCLWMGPAGPGPLRRHGRRPWAHPVGRARGARRPGPRPRWPTARPGLRHGPGGRAGRRARRWRRLPMEPSGASRDSRPAGAGRRNPGSP